MLSWRTQGKEGAYSKGSEVRTTALRSVSATDQRPAIPVPDSTVRITDIMMTANTSQKTVQRAGDAMKLSSNDSPFETELRNIGHSVATVVVAE
eukprot:7271257-Prymnesium_polylepis.1